VPLYINDEIISGMFKIAIERFIEVEKITNKQEVIINSNIPLCELTCGKVLQGKIEKNLNNKYNYKALLNWFKNTLQTVKESKCTKYITEPLFDTDFRGIIPIQNKFSIVDLDCNTHTSMTVIGKVSCVEKNSINSINPITTESCFDFINDRLSTLLSDELMDRLNLEELSEVEIKKHIEIIPIMIYV